MTLLLTYCVTRSGQISVREIDHRSEINKQTHTKGDE